MDLLLIDDEASLRRTLRTTLESMGHHVAEAAIGRAGDRVLRRERFDLAFLDLRLGQRARAGPAAASCWRGAGHWASSS